MLEKIDGDKALVCSDIHIDDYTYYKPSKEQLLDSSLNPLKISNCSDFRLMQPLMLAHRLAYLSDQYNTKNLFILGDLINRPLTSPNSFHVLKQFIEILVHKGIKIYYIIGQHDTVARNSRNIQDSFVTTINNDNVFYCHGKQFTMNGRILEFQNFDFEGECLFKDDTEIALGHISLGFGQEPVGKSLKVCIAGDIHEPVDGVVNGIMRHSCCTPLSLYPHQEDKNGYVGLLNLENNDINYTRIPTDGLLDTGDSFRYLRLKETRDYQNSLIETKIVNNDNDSFDDSDDKVSSFTNSITDNKHVITEIDKLVKESGYSDIYSKLNLTDMPIPINFDFKIKQLEINNFRSIKYMLLTEEDLNGCVYIKAKNGYGKSSILKALSVALLGDRNIKKYQKRNTNDNLNLKIYIEYNDKIYYIERWIGGTSYYISDDLDINNNDAYVEVSRSKREAEARIFKDLPFLNHLNYFICNSNSHFFEYLDRTKFIISIFNLASFKYIKDETHKYKNLVWSNIDNIEKQIRTLNGKIEYTDSILSEYNTKLEDFETHLDDYSSNAQELNTEYMNLNKDINSSVQKMKLFEKSLSDTESLITKYADVDKYNKAKSDIELLESHNSLVIEKELIKNELSKSKYKIDSLSNSKTQLIKSPKCTCPNCDTEFYTIDSTEQQIRDLDDKINELDSEYHKLEDKYNSVVIEELPAGTYNKSECEIIIKNYESSSDLIHKRDSLIKDLASIKEYGTSLYNSKINLLNGKSEEEYLKYLNDSIRFYNEYEVLKNQISKIESDKESFSNSIVNLESELDNYRTEYSRCEEFESMFDMSNLESIPYKIIDKVVHTLDTPNVRFSSYKELASGSERFDINAEINIGNDTWIKYEDASDGQKCILDLFILKAILKNIGKIGYLQLDEFFANLDEINSDQIGSFFSYIKKHVSTVLVTSHSLLFNGYDTRLDLELDDNDNTIIVK